MSLVVRVSDIQAKSNPSRGGDQRPEVRAESWTRSDNTFKFNFVAENHVATTSLLETTPPSGKPRRQTVCNEEGSGEFAFNFQIPAVTLEVPPAASGGSDPGSEPGPPGAQSPAPPTALEAGVPTESPVPSKPKKKKKSGKKKNTESSKSQETTSSSEGSHADKESVMVSAEHSDGTIVWLCGRAGG